jgi:hypothetical protein
MADHAVWLPRNSGVGAPESRAGVYERTGVRGFGTGGSCLPDMAKAGNDEHAAAPAFPRNSRRGTLSYSNLTRACCVAWLAIALIGCQKEPVADPATASPTAPPPAAVAHQAIELKDVFETDGGAVIGISYPPGLQRDPGLAGIIRDYAERARGNVLAAAGRAPAPDTTCDLSLAFTVVAQNPDLIAVTLDGSQYTGGAGSESHVARFVWLRRAARLLPANELIPSPAGWQAIAVYIRDKQNAALLEEGAAAGRADPQNKELEPAIHRMTLEPKYTPRLDPQGRIAALRFVLPVDDPGLEGLTTVEVPAAVLRPFIAPAYANWFAAQAGEETAASDPPAGQADEDGGRPTAMR